MLKNLIQIINTQLTIPARLNRAQFINKLAITFLYYLGILFLQGGIAAIILNLYFKYMNKDGKLLEPLIHDKSHIIKDVVDLPISIYFIILIPLFLSLYIIVKFVINYYKLHVSRLHDINCKGFWIIFSFIPLIRNIFGIILFTVPGSKGVNKYGDQPEPSTKKEIAFAIILTIIHIILALISFILMLPNSKGS